MPDSHEVNWLADVYAAKTIDALEAALLGHIVDSGGYPAELTKPKHRALFQAVEQRGWALVTQDPQGHLIPRIVRKPSSFNGTTYLGQSYRGGTWQNGAGYRWGRYALEAWVQKIGQLASRPTARRVVEWVLFGMPHRALLVLRAQEGAVTPLP